jgi:hypothetical protein
MIHKTTIENHNLQTLTHEIGDLRYDALHEFMKKITFANRFT